jgi:hypothetical protein
VVKPLLWDNSFSGMYAPGLADARPAVLGCEGQVWIFNTMGTNVYSLNLTRKALDVLVEGIHLIPLLVQ